MCTTWCSSGRYIPVASLAVADALVGVVAVLFLVERLNGPRLADTNYPLFVVICGCLTTAASGWHLVVMAVDRFVAVCYPMTYRSAMTSRRVCMMTSSSWVIAAALVLPYFIWLSPTIKGGVEGVVFSHFYSTGLSLRDRFGTTHF